MQNKLKAVTLIELIIAMILLSLVVLSLGSINVFSRFNLWDSDRRTGLQNLIAFVMAHMDKEIPKAIGNDKVYGANTVVDTTQIASDTAIRVFVDTNGNGQRDVGTDQWIAYRYRTTGAPGERYQIWYYPNYVNPSSPYEVLAKNIFNFTPTYASGNNYVEVKITSCSDPTQGSANCGTTDNPSVTMNTRIGMPSVSTN